MCLMSRRYLYTSNVSRVAVIAELIAETVGKCLQGADTNREAKSSEPNTTVVELRMRLNPYAER